MIDLKSETSVFQRSKWTNPLRVTFNILKSWWYKGAPHLADIKMNNTCPTQVYNDRHLGIVTQNAVVSAAAGVVSFMNCVLMVTQSSVFGTSLSPFPPKPSEQFLTVE